MNTDGTEFPRLEWLPNAPGYFTRLCDAGKLTSPILIRLLTDRRMAQAWTTLSRKEQSYRGPRHMWHAVWGAISHAKHRSNLHVASPTTRAKLSAGYKALEESVRGLADAINGGPLDVLLYQLLPDDVLAANDVDVAEWRATHPFERCALADKMMLAWPSCSEVLAELAEMAKKHSEDALLPEALPYTRNRGEAGRLGERVFVKELGDEFVTLFGDRMARTIASIATVVFEKPDGDDITRDFVRSVFAAVE